MAQFTYTAISRSGARLAGEMEAVTRSSVVEALHKLGHLPVDVVETAPAQEVTARGGARRFSVASHRATRSRSSRASSRSCSRQACRSISRSRSSKTKAAPNA